MFKEDGGLFGVAMGIKDKDFEISNGDLELIVVMQDAEDTFERLMEHAMRSVRLANEAEEILASLIGAWRCVTRARVAAGF